MLPFEGFGRVYSDVEKWFDKNLQLDISAPTLERCQDMIQGSKLKDTPFYSDRLRGYRIFIGEDARGSVPNAPKGLESGLDGVYW